MDENNEIDYIELVDDEGETFRMEIVGRVEFSGEGYVVFLPADMDEDDPDFGFVILKSVEEDGFETFDSVDDDDVRSQVYEIFLESLYEDDNDGEEIPDTNIDNE